MNPMKWEIIYQELEARKDVISPSDFRFYNIARLPLIARKTEEHADRCEICTKNLVALHDLVLNIPASTNDFEAWKNFGRQSSAVVKHLKESHGMSFHGYFLSLYTVIGLFFSALIVMGLVIFMNFSILNEISVLIILLGFLIGRVLGYYKDKGKRVSGKQI